jgi:hypothetical protein
VPERAWEFDSPLAYDGGNAERSPQRAERKVPMASSTSKKIIIGGAVLAAALAAAAYAVLKTVDGINDESFDDDTFKETDLELFDEEI